MRDSLTEKQSDALIDAEDAINEARDFICLATLAGDGLKGEIGSAYVRVLSCASEALLNSLLSLRDAKGGGHAE